MQPETDFLSFAALLVFSLIQIFSIVAVFVIRYHFKRFSFPGDRIATLITSALAIGCMIFFAAAAVLLSFIGL